MGCVLEINNLTKKYSTFELKSISFQIRAGEVMGFIGRNGAGKTTALKSILNLVHPDAGNVRILGMDYLDNEDEIKQRIGYAVGGTNYYKRKKLKDIVSITRIFMITGMMNRIVIILTHLNLMKIRKLWNCLRG